MNFGRGIPFHQDNGISQNRDSWAPETPGKPFPQGSDMIHVDMLKNQVGRENWNDLIGVYSDILKEGPDLTVSHHGSNTSGPIGPTGGNQKCNVGMGQNGGNVNSSLVVSQNGRIRNANLVSSQIGGIQNANVIMGQNGENQSLNVFMGHNGGVRNRNVGMSGIQNVNVGIGYNGGVQNIHSVMGQNGGNQRHNVGTMLNPGVQNRNSNVGQIEGNYNWNAGLDQYAGNHNLNVGMDQIGGNQNWNVILSQNGGNQNANIGATTGNLSQNMFSSSYAVNLPTDPANWSSEFLAGLLNAKRKAAMAAAMNEATQTSFQAQNRPVIPNSSTQMRSNWHRSDFSGSMPREQDHTFSSSHEVGDYNLKQLPIDGFPVPYRPIYNLNSPPRAEADVTSSIANFLQLEPVTPDKGKLLENCQGPQEVNSLVYGSSGQEKDCQEPLVVSLSNENNQNHGKELLESIVNSSSSVVEGKNAFDEGDEQGIDLNKTPQQKTPKRRKHRPKVIREGKPKRTPKPKAPEHGIPNKTPPEKQKRGRKNGLEISGSQQPNDVDQVCAGSPQAVAKRKYVRKKSLKTPESQQESLVEDVRLPTAETSAKSCRRTLKFDLERSGNAENHIEMNQGNIGGFNLNINPQDTENCTGINSISVASTVQIEEQNLYIAGSKDLQGSTYQMRLENSSLPEAAAPATPLPIMKTKALNAIARNLTMRNSILSQNGYNQVDRHASGEQGRVVFNADTECTSLERGRERMMNSTSQLFMENTPIVNGNRGLKRQSFEHINPRASNNMHPPFMYQKRPGEAIESSNGCVNHFDSSCLESNKKKKIQDGFYANISSSPSVSNSSKQELRGITFAQANSSIPQVSNTYFNEEKTTGNDFLHPMLANQNLQNHHGSKRQLAVRRSQEVNQDYDFNPLTSMVACNQLPTSQRDTANNYVEELRARNAYLFKQRQSLIQTSSNQRLNGTDQILQHKHNSADESHRFLPTTPKETQRSDYLQEIRTCQANVLKQKQGQNPSLGNRREMDKMFQHQKTAVESHQPSSTKTRGMPKKQKYLNSVDEISYLLEGLSISGDKDQHALVPYKADNMIIPFEPKKRKPRPRVDLDPETDRLWKLLMGKEGSEGAEAIDKDKEKWWEEERAVFRGRADSFIARMHLVQGDRRFSRWKGSVVDSVIGVFLTQNVSDHLSSSAFMSLVSKFPPHPTATNEACCERETHVLVEEPDIQVLEPNRSIKDHGKFGQELLYKHNSIIACESNDNKRITEEELVSQDSFDSVVFQIPDEQRSSSGSNSEAEDLTTGSKSTNNGSTLLNLLHPERGNLFDGFYSPVNGSTIPEEKTTNMRCQSEKQEYSRQNLRYNEGINLKSSPAFSTSIKSNLHQELLDPSNLWFKMTPDSRQVGMQYGAMSAEESLSSFPSATSGVTDTFYMNNRTNLHCEMQLPQTSMQSTHQGAFPPAHQIGSGPKSVNYQTPPHSRTHQMVRAFMRGPVDPAETLTNKVGDARKQGSVSQSFRGMNVNTEDRMSVVNKQISFENRAVEANSKEQTCSSREPLDAPATNNIKMKKGRAEDEKKGAFDWDSLRRQVLLNGGKRERSKDAADSLNYEALRSADVKKISDAIRERGMNNMLAERIQGFLNRLVKDHESIDLEWLRDVPPDKAKDYLLSIRGLGLKSVECVRLLTLHHLAFPVDTNVGRIAVRLGWVPLQPLPESLQLHLLEMYPVLESIQKYLWPRLCKLDQRTLYELHYQMITFGKVFCTKSKPNCNACPMRAECRHFASAFASARFALPAPEEKTMVSSAIPIVDDRKPKEAVKPLSLLPAENISEKDAGFFDHKSAHIIKEPIIEYPSSPHSESTEILERDIEDAFYEDPDEIPTIRLNMDEFTTNLQNLMQDNMELQGDMSKALVALNPEAASIPTPKLKNVSRLRTEHRVYELPDSHPLLDGLDRREPDDPSPYLLAIWTPGETATSIQPPENTCSARESGSLCNDSTCFSCNSTREANSQTVRGTLLVPCRTAMRGSFPLNGTYFQVNEMFADHESSLRPIDVPRTWLWNLPRRIVFFGTSVSTIFKGLTTEEIQLCFWRGFVCVRGFDQKSRAPRPLMARLHFTASRSVKKKDEEK